MRSGTINEIYHYHSISRIRIGNLKVTHCLFPALDFRFHTNMLAVAFEDYTDVLERGANSGKVGGSRFVMFALKISDRRHAN